MNEGTIPQKLKKVYVDLVSNDQCENVLRTTRLRSNFKLHPSFICAKEEDSLTTVCQVSFVDISMYMLGTVCPQCGFCESATQITLVCVRTTNKIIVNE